jgi:TRAP transporter TAXI family solute receptor
MAFCGLLAATPVYADSEHRSREEREAMLRHTMRDEINSGLLGIVSEGTDYTADLALSLAGEQNRLRLLPIAGAGALQNAKDVMFARGIDFGIVQTDVLDEIKRNPPFPGVEKYLQYVTKLYDQELHVLAGPDIQSVDDLKGKKVNFGLHDSGTRTTATAVFKVLGVEPDVTNFPHPLALDKLRRGEISALVYMATKPSRLFQDIRADENLHFLSITGNLPSNYTAIIITSDDYPELVSKDAPVNTVAVGTVLVAYNWPAKSERYQRINRFVEAFFAHLKEIKARRPKWQDFDISASVSGWTRFPAAEQWLKKAGLTPEPDKATAQEQVPLDPKDREALFQEFADYQRAPEVAKATAHLDPKRREALFRDFAEYQKTHRVIVAYHDTAANH